MTVYAIQNQQRWDEKSQSLVPKFNIDAAYEYGEVKFLLSPSASPFKSESIIQQLRTELASFTDDDHLLLVGNPCFIGWATAIAAEFSGGEVNLLQWSGKDQKYIPVRSKLF
jgi:hypothetical protein